MAEIVLGIGTSHTPLLSLPPELWEEYAQGDLHNPELVFPPDGWAMSFDEAVRSYVTPETASKKSGYETFKRQSEACTAALDVLSETLRRVAPDITIVISDDQDEWFYDSNMPAVAVYWGESVPLIPRRSRTVRRSPEVDSLVDQGYGDVPVDVPVPSSFGRYAIERLIDDDFDIAQLRYVEESYGGSVARHYPKREGELDVVRTTPRRPQGLPHGFAFVVKRLFANEPGPLLPVIQNTCYPPNAVTPRRCYNLGESLARAISSWPEPARVAIVASGGLSHFVVDESLDRMILKALAGKDAETLRTLPRNRLYSATSESLNWVTAAGALAGTPLRMELLDYVPVYRTEAGTGGGWAFARWQ